MSSEYSIMAVSSLAMTTKTNNPYVGAYLLSFSVFAERFSFWGLQAILVLFLIQTFSFDQINAFAVVGIFGFLSYASSVFGGMISDKLIGIWRSCIMGLFLCVLGNIILFFSVNMTWITLGLSILLMGSGLFSPSSNNILRVLYEKNQQQKDTSFLFTCVAGNISGALAPLIYGIFGAYGMWKYAFLSGIVLNVAALAVFVIGLKSIFFDISPLEKADKTLNNICYIVLAVTILISFVAMKYISDLDDYLYIALLPFLSIFVWLYRKQNREDKKRVWFILFITAILLLFYTTVFQIYSSLTIFIEKYVDRHVLSLNIPVPAFASLQCIFFILFAPIVNGGLNRLMKNGYNVSLLMRVPIGILIGVIAFICFGIGEYSALESGNCGIGWIVLGNLLLGLGEVFLYPPILAAIATFSPKRWAGTFMGMFSISLALSSFFSGQLAALIANNWTVNGGSISISSLSYVRIALLLLVVLAISVVVFLSVQRWYKQQLTLIYDGINV